MGVKHWVRALLVLSALPATVLALGLGEIRLKSALNAPLDAEIELVNASAEELSGLKAQLASRETFARYGLEWPAFLGSVTLTRGKSAAGSDVLRVRSVEPITEPFVTLLVDANWGRGRLVREYTLLLDPPTFAPTPTPPVPVAAAVTPAPAEAAPPRRQPDAEVRPAPEASAASDSPESVRVRRGDTLSGLASRAVPDRAGVSLEQVMVGLYRGNPRAFGATMNDLRAGALLRVPDIDEMTAISREAAISEVARQGSEWRNRGGATAAAEGAGRLRLVPPAEGAAPSAGEGGSGGDVRALQDRLGVLEKELVESRRLLELRSAQVAELQARLSAAAAAPPAAATPPVPAQAPAAVTPAPAVPSGTPPAAADATAAPSAEAPAAPAAAAPAAPEPPVAVARPAPSPAPAPVVAEEPAPAPGIVDTAIGLLSQFWWALAGLFAVVAGFLGFRSWQRKREAAAAEEGAVVLPPPPDLDEAVGTVETPVAIAETASLRRPNIAAPAEPQGFVVEESGEYARPAITDAPGPEPLATVVAADETLSGDTNLNLDQGDPLAEADFHMAYGLYDQAADLVKLAMNREPQRRDLRLKLAEVYFVWGNRDEFLRTARELHETRSAGSPGEWEKIVIMGRQIAPEEPLFDTAMGRLGGSEADLDLPLDAGSQELDIDLAGEGDGATQLLDTAVGAELLGASDHPTEIFEAVPHGRGGVGLEFNDGGTGEGPILDIDLGEDFSEAPTVEQPALVAAPATGGGVATIREKLDAALRPAEGAIDQTAELAFDDLGLDLGDLEKLADESDPGLEPTGRFAAGVGPASAEPERPRGSALGADVTEFIDLGDRRADLVSLDDMLRARSADSAAEPPLPEFDLSGAGDLHEQAPPVTVEPAAAVDVEASVAPAPVADPGFDLSTGEFLVDEPGELALDPVEPATISEVGTKLDLARAYIDMGDPDGARSILQEVLQEGSVSQKQEAQRLVEALPG
jgi:pilus assembly protein FimV